MRLCKLLAALGPIILCLTPSLVGQSIGGCVDDFEAKAAALNASDQWRRCDPLTDGDFARIRPVLEQHAADPALEVGLSAALIVFAEQPSFRGDLSDYAQTAFPPSQVTDISRLVLTALLSECQRTQDGSYAVWRALARNRFYRQPNAPLEFTELGDQIRACLVKSRDAAFLDDPDIYIPPFAFALSASNTISASIGQMAGLPAQDIENLRSFDSSFRQPILERLAAHKTIDVETWKFGTDGTQLSNQPLAILQNALIDNYKLSLDAPIRSPIELAANEQVRFLATSGLEAHLNRLVALWTTEAAVWKPDGSATVAQSEKAYVAERNLEAAIASLRDATFITPNTAAEYRKWVALAGGWDLPKEGVIAGIADKPIRPSWGRDWQSSANTAEKADLLEAAPLYSFVRLSRRLQTAGEEISELDRLWSLDDFTYLDRQAAEVFQLGFAAGLLPTRDGLPVIPQPTWLNAWRLNPKEITPGQNVFPQIRNVRLASRATLHPDHLKALRVVLAEYYMWYADLAYRRLGPQPPTASFTDTQTEKVSIYYGAALELLKAASTSPWQSGLGLLSSSLDRDIELSTHECALRQQQLSMGQDYVGQTIPWPATYAWDTIDGLKPIVALLQNFQQTTINSARIDSLKNDQGIAILEEQKADALEQAQTLAVRAASFEESALKLQLAQQNLRVDIAALMEKEATAMVDAQQAAVDAADNQTISQGLRAKLAQDQVDVLNAQIDQLKASIDSLAGEIPEVQQQIQAAQDELPVLRSRATRAWEDANQPSFWSVAGPILQSVGGAVSMYFTGVNLVSISESAIGTVKAGQAGDWASAAKQAYNTVNVATNGQFGKQAEQTLGSTEANAAAYLTNLMPDSIRDSVKAVKDTLHVDDAKAAQLATEAISKRAALTGLSFVNSDATLSRVAGDLGLSPAKRNDLSKTITAEYQLAVVQSLDSLGQDFRDAASAKVPGLIGNTPWKDVDWSAVRQSMIKSQHIQLPTQLEGTAAGLIALVHQQLAGVDTGGLKTALLTARDKVTRHTAELAGTTLERVDASIDNAAQDYEKTMNAASSLLSLDPPPLPAPVRDQLSQFHAGVDKARGNLALLVTPSAQNDLVAKLTQSSSKGAFDQNLESVMNELGEGLSAAKTSMIDASRTLANLSAELSQLRHDSHVAEVNQTIARYEVKAKSSTQEQQEHLLLVAGDAVLVARQQSHLEKLGGDVYSKQLSAQHTRVEQASAALKGVELDHRIALHKKEQADTDYYEWASIYTADKQDSWRHETELWYRNYCNLKLMQVWRLISVFEPQPETWDLQQFGNVVPGVSTPQLLPIPKYGIPTTNDLQTTMAAYEAGRAFGKLTRLKNRPLVTTIQISQLRALNPPNDIKNFLDGVGDRETSLALELKGETALKRLLSGLSFSILPNDYEPDSANQNPRPAIQGLLSRQDGFQELSWHVGDADRLRILGVYLEIPAGVLKPGGANFYLKQEQDGWFVGRRLGEQPKAIALPIPPPQFQSQFGTTVHENSLVMQDVSALPVFGSYTLRIRRQDLGQIKNPALFKATLHFVAIGVTPQ